MTEVNDHHAYIKNLPNLQSQDSSVRRCMPLKLQLFINQYRSHLLEMLSIILFTHGLWLVYFWGITFQPFKFHCLFICLYNMKS